MRVKEIGQGGGGKSEREGERKTKREGGRGKTKIVREDEKEGERTPPNLLNFSPQRCTRAPPVWPLICLP